MSDYFGDYRRGAVVALPVNTLSSSTAQPADPGASPAFAFFRDGVLVTPAAGSYSLTVDAGGFTGLAFLLVDTSQDAAFAAGHDYSVCFGAAVAVAGTPIAGALVGSFSLENRLDRWATALPGAYANGTAGKILGSQGGLVVTGTVQAGATTTSVSVLITGGYAPVIGGVWDNNRTCLFLPGAAPNGQLASCARPVFAQSAPVGGVVGLTFAGLPQPPVAGDLVEVI